VVVVAVTMGRVDVTAGAGNAIVVVVGSLHPNQPGVLHVADVDVLIDEVVVVVLVVVIGSLHPNQPGVLQVVVVAVFVGYVVVVVVAVVLSSRQPHHPGVLHVDVLV
jgi:high-affinity Fe2+/Pb2+ permease